jgi:hypothetical protein
MPNPSLRQLASDADRSYDSAVAALGEDLKGYPVDMVVAYCMRGLPIEAVRLAIMQSEIEQKANQRIKAEIASWRG